MKRFHGFRADRVTLALVIGTLAITAVLPGCAGDDDELNRNNIQIAEVNQNLPLLSDLYNNGADLEKADDDFIPIDYIPVKFQSRPADPALTLNPNQAFGKVLIHTYSVDFVDNDFNNDGVNDVNDIVDSPMNALVPANGEVTASILIVPGGIKTINHLRTLYLTGGEALTSATISFSGEEQTSHSPVTLTTGIVVGFADYADKK